jgi:hypothetical protein
VTALLLNLILLVQGLPALPGQSGTVMGNLRTATGAPAVGVRVSAMAKPDNPADLSSASSLTSLAETDETGQFRIENIPPGSYYIVAGRVDMPTYFPGTNDVRGGRLVAVAAGETVFGIDFAIAESSFRLVGNSSNSGPAVTVRFKVEDNGKLPVSSGGGFTTIRLTRPADGVNTDVQLNQSTTVTQTTSAGFRVSVENLPADYEVKSMTYGSVDLTKDPLRVGVVGGTASFSTAAVSGPPGTTVIRIISFGPSTNSTFTLSTMLGASAASPTEIMVTLAKKQPTSGNSGVRVTGRARAGEIREIYLSGVHGTLFEDGTFEFHGVPPGRHSVATVDTPGRALGASIIVGTADLNGVDLDDVPVLPSDVRMPKSPGSAGLHPAGSVLSPASFRGRVVDETSGEPLVGALVIISGSRYLLDEDGRVEITRLLPGHYDVEIQARAHPPAIRSFDLDETNVETEWKIQNSVGVRLL